MFGDRPVIAAGSTGSIPATADLLRAIAKLPRGALVLPGLDTSLDADGFAALQKADAQPHGHPQYGLVQLVQALGSRPGLVEELVPAAESADRGAQPRAGARREDRCLGDVSARRWPRR